MALGSPMDRPSAEQAHSLDNEPSDKGGCATKQQKVTYDCAHTGGSPVPPRATIRLAFLEIAVSAIPDFRDHKFCQWSNCASNKAEPQPSGFLQLPGGYNGGRSGPSTGRLFFSIKIGALNVFGTNPKLGELPIRPRSRPRGSNPEQNSRSAPPSRAAFL